MGGSRFEKSLKNLTKTIKNTRKYLFFQVFYSIIMVEYPRRAAKIKMEYMINNTSEIMEIIRTATIIIRVVCGIILLIVCIRLIQIVHKLHSSLSWKIKMDEIINIISDIMEISTARIIVRVVCGILSLIVCFWLITFISANVSAQKELHGWVETTAVVKKSSTTGESLSPPISRQSSIDDTWDTRDTLYKVYMIWYALTAEGSAWGGSYLFEYSGSISGETSHRDVEIPTYAYSSVPKEGDIVSFIYDSNERGNYKFGTIEDWRKNMNKNLPGFCLPLILVPLITVLIVFDFYLKRYAQEWEGP